MSLDNSFTAESRCVAHNLDSVFLDALGNEGHEAFYHKAIEIACQQGKLDIAEQAIAWLDFSTQTREFHERVKAIRRTSP